MFTFGIFTTHLPYVAFVVFYAYFLLFGVNKAVSGELETGEKFCKTEWSVEKHINKDDVQAFHYSDFNCDNFRSHRYKTFHSKPGISWPELQLTAYISGGFGFQLFSRPPPTA